MNLNNEIQVATDKFLAEKLPQLVEEKVSKMVNDVLDDVFRSYSDTAKAIKSKIEEKLDVNLQEFDLVDYNHLVSKAINDNLMQLVNVQPIMDLCQDAIGFVKQKTIKLSDIVEMFKDAAMEDSSDSNGEITVIVEVDEKHGWTEVWLDLDANTKQHNCGIKFIISDSRKKIFSFKSSSYLSNLGNVSPSKMTQLSSIEHKVFRLYSAQVEVVVDELKYDNNWYRDEY
ncbi:hypothetical protein [Flavobacterium caseinilyticum]|uniref:Uncharacterized protein n=1 Tax=Flavobacterium caseinilyticum TaxID=2541732 RepID=A0A4R5AUR4_9FLAO|nr:hypothetical protein [Flavobacterium caseinilyticum]TDD77098.1 hypothetical protein E0F89_05735 [Flavobacterium caseinilyticum]